MANRYQPWRAVEAARSESTSRSFSSTTFSAVRVGMREVDRPGPSGAAAIALSSDSSSEEDSDSSNTEACSSGDV